MNTMKGRDRSGAKENKIDSILYYIDNIYIYILLCYIKL